MSLGRGKKQRTQQCLGDRLSPPDRVKIKHLLFTISVVEHLRHGVSDDVRAVATLVPRLLRNLCLELAEDDGLGDQPTIPELVILRVAFRPRLADLFSEFGKVLLRAARYDMRVPVGRVRDLGEVSLVK